LQYALGLLYEAQGRVDIAREAQARALQENLGFAPAHAALGRMAAARRDTGTAAAEYALAAQIAPEDAAMVYWYGAALVRAQRPSEGVQQLRTAVKLEPYFAQPYFELGRACEMVKDSAGAVAAYTEFIKRAPLSSSQNIATAKDHLAQFGGKAP
jgi:Tfp pilus assembly protein PilF